MQTCTHLFAHSFSAITYLLSCPVPSASAHTRCPPKALPVQTTSFLHSSMSSYPATLRSCTPISSELQSAHTHTHTHTHMHARTGPCVHAHQSYCVPPTVYYCPSYIGHFGYPPRVTSGETGYHFTNLVSWCCVVCVLGGSVCEGPGEGMTGTVLTCICAAVCCSSELFPLLTDSTTSH